MFERVARKPSSDPIQEKLRQNKVNWNKDVSSFINDLIHLKKLMNGYPSKFHTERSFIKNPIPADPATIIGSLAGDFQELAQKANSIIQEQANYSKNRRQKHPKAPVGTPSAVSNLEKQLAAWEQKYDLIVEGSNPISRFLTRMTTSTRGNSEQARMNRIRMDILRACAKAYKALGKLQIQIVKSSRDSITEANKLIQDIANEWMMVIRLFNIYKSSISMESTVKEKKEQPKVTEQILPKDATTSSQLEAVAQAFIKKWLGKAKHQLLPRDTSSLRLEAYKLAETLRKELDQFMDALESGLNIEDLIPSITKDMTSLKLLLRSLHQYDRGEAV